MAHRRPAPEGFDEKLDLLVQLEQQKDEVQERIDEVLLEMLAKQPPTATIAERLQITAQTVSSRRVAALRRREQRAHRAEAA
jgi:hypothetical protein